MHVLLRADHSQCMQVASGAPHSTFDCGCLQAGTAHGIFGESDCAKTCQPAEPEVCICCSLCMLRPCHMVKFAGSTVKAQDASMA